MYGVWNLVAGTYGFFFPYILEAVGNMSRSRELRAAGDLVPGHGARGRDALHADDRPRRAAADAPPARASGGRGFRPFILFEVSFVTALINVVLFGIGAGHRAAIAIPALERPDVPDAAALDCRGLDVRRRADGPGRLTPVLADGLAGRLPARCCWCSRGC